MHKNPTRAPAPRVRPHPELRLADRASHLAVGAAAVAALLAVGFDFVSEAVTVPSLSAGLFRQTVVVPIVETSDPAAMRPALERPETPPLIEHTAEESCFEIEKKVVPLPEPEIEPTPEPVVEQKIETEPEPVVKAELPPPEQEKKSEEKPKEEPKPKPKKPVNPKVKAETKATKKAQVQPAPAAENTEIGEVPQTASPGADAQGTSGGIGKSASGNALSASEATNRENVLAVILNVIEANKNYPRRARQTGIEGVVRLAVRIDADGRIAQIAISEKHASVLLNRAALKAAEKLVGMHIEGIGPLTVEVPVRFELTGR